MIICSCSGVTDRDIRQAITWMRASDPYALITPGEIYRALGKSAECGGCIRLWLISGFRVVGGSWRRSVVMMDVPEDWSYDLGCSPLSAGRSRPRWMP